jgi:hypothetical protein
LLFGLVAAHGAFLGRRIATLAEAERGSTDVEEAASFARRKRSLQRLSLTVPWVNLAVTATVTATVAALAANA